MRTVDKGRKLERPTEFRAVALSGLLSVLFFVAAPSAGVEILYLSGATLPVLTRASEIHALSPREAARGYGGNDGCCIKRNWTIFRGSNGPLYQAKVND